MSNLTDKQIRFCEEYIVDLNATQAAIRAGYAEKTAMEQGSRLLSNVKVEKYLHELRAKRSQEITVSADEIINELKIISFSDVTRFEVDDNGKVTCDNPADLRAIQSVKVTRRSFGDSGSEVKTEIRLWNKNDSLKQLGMHKGIFEKDNQQKHPSTEYVFPEDTKPDAKP